MEQPATTNSTTTKKTRASTADLTAVPLLQAMLDQVRGELATARVALDSERSAVRALRRDKAAEIKAARDEEARKYRDSLSDLKSRLERDHEDALQRQKDAVTKSLNAELLRALKVKDAEMRHELNDASAREESLKVQIRDAFRASRDVVTQQQSGANSGEIQKLQQEVTALRHHNKQLEERLQVVVEADRQKAADLRSQHEEHEMQLIQLKKTSQQETHRLLEELKSKERMISQLERHLKLQTGRVEEQRDRLLERQHEQHPLECECSEETCSRARERHLIQRLMELQASTKKAMETHAQEKKEMIRKLREVEGKSPVSRQQQKTQRTLKRNNNQPATSPATSEQNGGETVTLDNVISCRETTQSQDTEEELEKLRTEIEERDRTIAKLRQAAREKDRKLDHLSNRHRKEQMRQYYRQFMELEPVAEIEEDSGAGEDSPTSSSSPSLSPQPFPGDIWGEITNKEYHDTMYSCLLKEHLELQRDYQFLQIRLKRELAEPNRIRLRLEHELAASRTHVRELKRMLAEQKGGGTVLTERIAALQAEAHDLREQNELLEFRILELEECHENSSVRSQGPDTRDVWTDTENDDISDSGVQSLPTSEDTNSETDLGIHDIKLEIRNEELKGRLLQLAKNSSSTEEQCCLQQVLALLENYESRLEKLGQQSESCSTVASERLSDRTSLDNGGGRALRNLSESSTAATNDSSKFASRIIATVLPFTDQNIEANKNSDETITEGDEFKKQLKNAECLQESGIFEEVEYNSQGTQTDIINVRPVFSEFKTSFETCLVGDLSAEIQKLNQFRERVEEAGNCCTNKKLLRVEEGRGDEPSTDCISHRKELQYCRERLQLLEDKVLVFESSGDQQTRLLAERLQKEVRLSAQVKDLSAKVEHLVTENGRLEEEKCEFEEAENDTRLKCQKLEVKLVALSEKKSDLQVQLQQERRNMSRLRNSLAESERKKQDSKGQMNYLELMLNKYEQRNYELEEREVDLKHRMEMLENSVPAIMIWNMWRLVQDSGIPRANVAAALSNTIVRAHSGDRRPGTSRGRSHSQEGYPPCCSSRNTEAGMIKDQEKIPANRCGSEQDWKVTEVELLSKLQALEAEAGPLNAEIQKCKNAEDMYKRRIKDLETELYGPVIVSDGAMPKTSARFTESEPMSNARYTSPIYCQYQTLSTPSAGNTQSASREGECQSECMKKLEGLLKSEADMKRRIAELERKEKAYMETIQKADDLWNDMEEGYQKRISTAEDKEAALRNKVKKLEESETKLRQTLNQNEENDMFVAKIQNMEDKEKTLLERIRNLETEKNQLAEENAQLRETLQVVQAEVKGQIDGRLKEELAKERKLSKELKQDINTMEKEIKDLTDTQTAEINGLKKQLSKTSRDLVDLECTNGELKEEVETLETKVSELKTVIEDQKQSEEKMMISMSQTILEKEQALEEAKRTIRDSQAPTAQQELNDAGVSLLADFGGEAVRTHELPSMVSEPSIPAAKPVSSGRRLVELPCGCKCICPAKGEDGVSPVSLPSSLNQKPVLRRWLFPQKLHPTKELSPWRQC